MKDNFGELRITNQAGKKVTILFDGVIGSSWFEEGITLKAIKKEIDQAGDVDEIQLDINSPGGLVDEGLAIYNWLVQHKAMVTTNIIGMAASAASFVAQAGDVSKRKMAANSELMIHNSRFMAVGDKNIMKKAAKILEQTDDLINMTYGARTGLGKSTIAKMMDKETYMTAEQALELGFIDEIVEIKKDKVEKAEDYKPQIEAMYSKWLDSFQEFKQEDFDNNYRIAASAIPDWQKKPEKPYADIIFNYDPADLDAERISDQYCYKNVSVNALRFQIANHPNDEIPQKLLEVFKKTNHENQKYLKTNKIEIVHNGQTYLFNEKEIQMYNQRINELEGQIEDLKSQIEERNNSIKELGKLDATESPELKAQLEAQKKSNELLQALVDDLQAKNKERADKAAESEVEDLVSDGYILGASKQKFIDEYKSNKSNYDFIVNHLKSEEPRYKGLFDTPAGTTEIKTETEDKSTENLSPQEQLVAYANDIRAKRAKEGKNISFSEAFNQAKLENKQLIESLRVEKSKAEASHEAKVLEMI